MINRYFSEIKEICDGLDVAEIQKTIDILAELKKNGRLFILGVGGSAANASHAVNDFRKICGIETYAPTDNVAELTARTNDNGWDSIFVDWLKVSKLKKEDVILILSVGGGNAEKRVSVNLINALDFAKEVGCKILGIVSRDGGRTKQVADACILIPVVNAEYITPHAEAFQAILWHLIVNHSNLK